MFNESMTGWHIALLTLTMTTIESRVLENPVKINQKQPEVNTEPPADPSLSSCKPANGEDTKGGTVPSQLRIYQGQSHNNAEHNLKDVQHFPNSPTVNFLQELFSRLVQINLNFANGVRGNGAMLGDRPPITVIEGLRNTGDDDFIVVEPKKDCGRRKLINLEQLVNI